MHAVFCGIKGDTIPPPTGGDRGGHKGWERSISNRIKISGYDFNITTGIPKGIRM